MSSDLQESKKAEKEGFSGIERIAWMVKCSLRFVSYEYCREL